MLSISERHYTILSDSVSTCILQPDVFNSHGKTPSWLQSTDRIDRDSKAGTLNIGY